MANTEIAVSTIIANATDDSLHNDLDLVRSTLIAGIDTAVVALQEIQQIADASPKPAAYLAFAKVLDSIVNANKELVNLHKSKAELAPEHTSGPKITERTLHITTADLQDMIEAMLEKDMKVIENGPTKHDI